MTRKDIEKSGNETLLAEIDELLSKRLQLLHDLVEVLARSLARIEQKLDAPTRHLDPSDRRRAAKAYEVE